MFFEDTQLRQVCWRRAGLAATAIRLDKPIRYKEVDAVMERHLLESEQTDKQATPPTWSPT
jgi:hypothetical protein